MARTEVFNSRRTKLMRRKISRTENYSTIFILAALAVIVVWVLGRHDSFDPQERDLPIELLYSDTPEIEIYTRPLKPWVEPGQVIVSNQFDFGLFPEAIVDEDWQPVGRIRRFDADNLYEKINGEAEKFIKQRFISLEYLSLRSRKDGAELAIELFDQGDLGGSLGVFAEHAGGREVQESGGVTYFNTTAGVIGRVGQYFFRVAGDRESNAINRKAVALVHAFASLRAVAGRPESSQAPEGFSLLRDRLGLEEAEIQFQESNVFQYDFANRFWFGNAGIDDKARLFVHIADGQGEASELMAMLVEEQSYEYATQSASEQWVLFRHEFLNTYFALSQRGRYVYGIEKLPRAEDADALMRRLEQVLTDA